MCHEEFIRVAGYECLKTNSPQTKRILHKLCKVGVIVFRCDGGLAAAITHKQLVEIADIIGLTCYQTRYEVVLIDTNIIKPIDGVIDIQDDNYPSLEKSHDG